MDKRVVVRLGEMATKSVGMAYPKGENNTMAGVFATASNVVSYNTV